MILSVLILLACAVSIYVCCEYFVNGVEWVGLRLGVSKSAVGTVLAAFGTALPESVVTFVAVVGGHDAYAKQIGVGAALGGPLVLSTIAYAVVGGCFVAVRPQSTTPFLQPGEQRRLAGDQAWFLVIFALKVALGLVAFLYKPWLGGVFLAAYAAYTWREMSRSDAVNSVEVELEPLKFRPHDANPAVHWAILQTGLALIITFVSSQIFVQRLEIISPALGFSGQLTAMLLSPIATELPETLNAVIWVRQGKATLALGNISGSMMIQATIPSALGIIFTPWLFDKPLIIAAAVTFLAIAVLWVLLRTTRLHAGQLAAMGLFYLIFAAAIALD